jgi:hypothetical protein
MAISTDEAQASRPSGRSILRCPECLSYNAEVLNTSPLKGRCVDCGTIYKIHPRKPIITNGDDQSAGEDEQEEDFTPRKRKTNTQKVGPVPAPDPKELEFNTVVLEEIIRGGPGQLKKAEQKARKLAKLYGEEFEAKWFLETTWLKQMDSAHRARARYALKWRPHFLAALALSHSPRLAARAAHISPMTAYFHRRKDPDFAEQWEEAESHAADLILGRAFQRALEGDCEPIYYKGKIVGHIRKFDSRLQIEMLRAFMPERFKTPGQPPANINTGQQNILVLDEATRAKLMAANRERIMALPDAPPAQDVQQSAK